MAFFKTSIGALMQLADVEITSPTTGQILKYDGTNQVWINSSNNLNDLADVTLTSVANGQVLKYDATNQKWINGVIS